MSYKDRLANWVEDHIYEDDDGNFRVQDPFDGELEDAVFTTEDEIRDVLWERACALDATDLYGLGEHLAEA